MQSYVENAATTAVVTDEPTSPSMLRKVAIASCIGSTVEWYDFFIYATASALVFNKLFFPQLSPLIGSLVALGTYATGFVARPIGGLVFGIIGDRQGRKSALVWTLLMVGTATFLIGLLPTYDAIGAAGAVFLMLVRLIHGFGIGGEQGNAILITCEHAPNSSRGFYGSLVQIGAPCGFVLPLGIFAILTSTLSDEAFLAWGWRIPFLLSALLVGIGLYIRLHLTESPIFKKQHQVQRNPVGQLLREEPRFVLLGIGSKLLESTVFTTYAVILTAYAVSQGVARSTMTTGTLIAIVAGRSTYWARQSTCCWSFPLSGPSTPAGRISFGSAWSARSRSVTLPCTRHRPRSMRSCSPHACARAASPSYSRSARC
jgi:MFS transporter, MHS family, shikimate and dehydroshikimate transport protein